MSSWRLDSPTAPWSDQGTVSLENVPTGRRTVILVTEYYYGCKVTKNPEKDTTFIFDPNTAQLLYGKVVPGDGGGAHSGSVQLCQQSLAELGLVRGLSGYQLGPYGIVAHAHAKGDGSFRFGRVEPGRYLIKASTLEYAPPQTIEVKPDGETLVKLTTRAPANRPPPLRQPATSSDASE